ncbi:hypothetical protein BDZ89DRAFT_1113305 [Hymenopellis radicata]|nr:hypothetical protein BDZ89DRAFT_1113305 [Hymenopellis radicata]
MSAQSSTEVERRKAVIPRLPKNNPGQAWRAAVKQWTEINPSTGYALKDWPASWYKGRVASRLGSTRNGRKLVAFAYKQAGSDEKFEEEFPAWKNGYAALLAAIRERYCLARESINGTRAERRQKREAALAAMAADEEFASDEEDSFEEDSDDSD